MALPNNDRIRSFDDYRVRVVELPEAIAVVSPARREELCRIVIERVVVNHRQLESIVWTPPARPFFENSGSAPKGAQAPTRCQMTTRSRGTSHERSRGPARAA